MEVKITDELVLDIDDIDKYEKIIIWKDSNMIDIKLIPKSNNLEEYIYLSGAIKNHEELIKKIMKNRRITKNDLGTIEKLKKKTLK